ncbi:hypothetical protein H8E88_28605 [candidate division KSB1 bacterium]|nr:hypothetical protein [candidate division KSB1 bacterium]MBL7094721.1 hypothetical protein [candidate division KSB1 bacterium]
MGYKKTEIIKSTQEFIEVRPYLSFPHFFSGNPLFDSKMELSDNNATLTGVK